MPQIKGSKKFPYVFLVRYGLGPIGLSLMLSSCTNFASNPRACDEAPSFLALPRLIGGNVFQLSPCTSIEPLRIENGFELEGIAETVRRNIENRVHGAAVDKFATKMGCRYEAHTRFFETLIANKDIIWHSRETSARQVVKVVRELTKQDLILKNGCW